MKKNFKIIFLDIDGSLTDGKLYYSSRGEFMKSFNVKDGFAIKNMLPLFNIIPVVISGRKSKIVKRRCKNLGIKMIYQNVEDKSIIVEHLIKINKLKKENLIYFGDDLNDLSAMKMCKIKGCPSDADKHIKKICNFISSHKGGNGALREFIEFLIN